MNASKKTIPNHKNDTIIALSIFFIFFLLIALLQPIWGFDVDDGALLWHAQINSWQDILTLFFKTNIWVNEQPSNVDIKLYQHLCNQSFFSTSYRPLALLTFSWQVPLFGSWAYGYFLINIALHALAASLFFLVLRLFFARSWSLLGTLLFSFHASMAKWIGWIGTQQYALSISLIFMAILLYNSYLHTPKKRIFFTILFLFFLALLSIEVIIIIPFLLILFYFLYKPQKISYVHIIPFFIFSGIFLGLKAINTFQLGLPFMTSSQKISLATSLKNILLKCHYLAYGFITDFFKIAWIADGQVFIKIIIFSLQILCLSILFYYTTNKKIVITLMIAGIAMLWPCIILHYADRYLFHALPFFIALIITLSVNQSAIAPKKIFFVLLCIMVNNFFYVLSIVKKRGLILHTYSTAVAKLKHNHLLKNKPLCFTFLPLSNERLLAGYKWLCGFTKECWLFGINPGQPIYYDKHTFLKVPTVPTSENIQITNTNNPHELIFDPKNTALQPLYADQNEYDELYKMGTLNAIPKNNKWIYKLDPKWQHQNIIFISWDYAHNNFVVHVDNH